MRFVGHRGASHIVPRILWLPSRGDGAGRRFECDLQSRTDGTLLVLHLDTRLRSATQPAGLSAAAARRFRELVRTPVGELNYADVCDVDVGSWMSTNFASERPPRFDEALLMKAPDVFAELKGDIDPDLVGALGYQRR